MILSLALSAFLMLTAIAFHYWSLGRLLQCLPKNCDHHSHFLQSLSVLFLLVCVHLVEIVWFAAGLYASSDWLGLGALGNEVDASFMNFFFHSAVTYSTLGLSEIPIGHLKFMTALESLTGIILLTWSATFFYSVMGRDPKREESPKTRT